MQRPSGVTLTTALMAVLTIVGTVATFTMPIPVAPSSPAVPAGMMGTILHFSAVIGFIISATFVVLYYIGYSWVRWVVMVYSLFPILGLIRIKTTFGLSPISGGVALVSGLLGLFLLYYLNTPPVRDWFNAPKGSPTA